MRPFFAFRAKKPLHTGVRTGCHYFICLLFCVRVCNVRRFFLFARAVRGRFPQTRDLWKRHVWSNAWDVFRLEPSRGGRGRRAAVAVVVCFGWGGFFRVFFSSICFILRTHTACCKYEAALPHLPLYEYRGAYRAPVFERSEFLIDTSQKKSLCVCD